MKLKSSTVVKSVLVGTPVFLAGCSCTPIQPIVTTPVVAADGVPVVASPMAGYHYSPFYHGFVPIFIPLGGIGGGNTYQTFYNRVPAAERSRYSYATPTSSGRASAAPIRATPTSSSTSAAKATPTSTSAARPTSGTSAPASSSHISRGIAGSVGMGHGSSAS